MKRSWCLLLLTISCRPVEEPATQARRSALDFGAGAVSGQVLWNGSLIDAAGSGIIRYSVREGGMTKLLFTGNSYVVPALAVGPHTLELWRVSSTLDTCPAAKLGETTFSISANTTTTADFDLTATAGRVTGTVTIDGATASFVSVVVGCGSAFVTNSAGVFSGLLAPGPYEVTVSGTSGYLGSFDIVVAAGTTTNVGVLNGSTANAGSVRGSVAWNDAAVVPEHHELFVVATSATGGAGWEAGVRFDGSYDSRRVAPDRYLLEVRSYVSPGQVLATGDVTVSAGGVATANFDITANSGRFLLAVTLDGATPGANIQFEDGFGFGAGSADGRFALFAAPGSFHATVDAHPEAGGVQTKSPVDVSVVAGTTTDAGTVALVTWDPQIGPVGAVRGAVTWNGAPVPAPDALQMFVSARAANGRQWEALVQADGQWALTEAPPGNYVASIGTFIYDAGGNLNMVGAPLATGNVVVSEGTTANLDFDLTGAAGRIVGALTVNAAPAIGHLSRINPTTFDVFVSVTAGRFSQILAPGSYTTTFFVPGEREQFDVGSVSFTVVAGQTTFLNGGVGQDVLPGNNNSFHIGGGRLAPGGLTITVNGETITSGTLWVEEGTLDGQPPPPSGYRFVGVNYFWDINTIPHPLFECSPPGSPCIEVCINYGLLSVPNEATVGLVHDDGVTTCPDAGGGTTRWCNITTDRSASANWVCGNTSSLSPFALVAAIDEVGPVFENVPETIVAYATSTAGATVVYTPPTATDALDGGRPVTCAPASGTAFPVGKTTVTCTASDTIGNPGEAAFTVWVQYQAPADASFFLKPIRPDGSSRFRLGRAVPVKFQLTGASAGITNLVARLTVTRISDAVRGTVDCEGDEDGEDTDMLFKYRKGKGIYGYRWKTRGESQGTYRLRADLGDGVTHEVNVSLKMPL